MGTYFHQKLSINLKGTFSMKSKTSALVLTLFIAQSFLAINLPSLTLPVSASSSHAYQNGSIEGSVADPTGAKVATVRVLLRTASGAPVAETQTDAAGHFSFAKVPAGEYEIVVEAA